ncbi:MAG TPA: hypothetical protein ENK52_05625 [Saprospiraceae bacterium]|nr:hypothetical protein [Saprospiraceae bacterium]
MRQSTQKNYTLLFTALVLGLGWAVRGHFGHEWGAAWAGAMGALAIVVSSGRADWQQSAPKLAALGAVGWAIGGMMSYGMIVGYCRGTEFLNVAYGYTMLLIVGGLYGFMGGGLLGLGLESSEDKKIDFPTLFTQMLAGGWLFWGLVIFQLEWLMTPPRSELWAACFGAAIALAWYLYREGFYKALRVAAYAALGGGFGFSFGNFIQTLGSASGYIYNWWNVMEFTLGFCGGLGMAYAVKTSNWKTSLKPSKTANWLALLFVFFAVPATNYITSFDKKHLTQLAANLKIQNVEQFVKNQQLIVALVLLFFVIASISQWKAFQKQDKHENSPIAVYLLFGISFYYILFAYLLHGLFLKPIDLYHSESLYVPILLMIFALWFFQKDKKENVSKHIKVKESWRTWAIIGVGLLLVILIMTSISINAHEGLGGMHNRF